MSEVPEGMGIWYVLVRILGNEMSWELVWFSAKRLAEMWDMVSELNAPYWRSEKRAPYDIEERLIQIR